MATNSKSFKVDKILNKFAQGKVLSVKQIEKLGVRNVSAHISYIRKNIWTNEEIVTSKKNDKTFYGFSKVA